MKRAVSSSKTSGNKRRRNEESNVWNLLRRKLGTLDGRPREIVSKLEELFSLAAKAPTSLPASSTAVNPSTSTSSARPASSPSAHPSIGQPVRASGDDAWLDLGCGERSTRLPVEVSTALDNMLGPREWYRLASTGYENCCAIAAINNSSSAADGHTSDEDAVALRSRWADLIEERLTEESYQSLFSNDGDVIIEKLTLEEVLATLRSDKSIDAAPLYAIAAVLNIFVIAAQRTVSGRDQHVELPANDPVVAGSAMTSRSGRHES